MRYPGGKFRCYQQLINLIPPHRVYIESHLGGGAILRHKRPAEVNIGIDIDPHVIASFTGFGPDYEFVCSKAEHFLAEYRFRGDEFIYVDPPYWPAARRSQRRMYRHDYTDEDHLGLLKMLRRVPCRIMVSGYNNPFYAEVLADWHHRTFRGTSHVGPREESLWLNYEPAELHDTRHLGVDFHERQSIRRKRARWVAKFSRETTALQQAILDDLHAAYSARRRS